MINKTRQDKTRQDKKLDHNSISCQLPTLLGGFGDKCNNDTQYHLQKRIFDSDGISTAITTAFMPWFLIREDDVD